MIHSILYDSTNYPIILGKSAITCYILEDRQQVFTIFSLQKALGYDGKYEIWLFEFLTEINHSDNFDLSSILMNPIKICGFDDDTLEINALDSDFIIPICQNIIDAKKSIFFNKSQVKFYNKALQIVTFLKNKPIKDYINHCIGYKVYKNQILDKSIQFLQMHNNESIYKWIKTFPDSFIETVFDLNNMNWNTVKQNPEILGNLFDEIIFSRIDLELLEDLRTQNPKRAYKRKNNEKQELEHPKLKKYLASLQPLIAISGNNWNIFTQLLNKAFPMKKNYIGTLHHAIESKLSDKYSGFNEKLLNSLKVRK